MKKFIKIASLAALFTFSTNSFVNAGNIDSQEKNITSFEVQENIDVSDQSPLAILTREITTYGTNTPLSKWNLNTQGQYDFWGSNSISRLYTDYYVTGKSQVTLVITNNSFSNLLNVELRDMSAWNGYVWGAQVGLGKTITVTIPVNSSKNYYLTFAAPSSFTGYIK